MDKGIKYDTQKPRWSLVPWGPMAEVVAVLEYGAKKYKPNNWMYVRPKMRYWDAAFRHTMARLRGEKLDPETGLHHTAHAICCLLFLMWHDGRK